MGYDLRILQQVPRRRVSRVKLHARWLLVVVIAAEVSFLATSVTAQWLQLGQWEGSLEGVTEYQRQETREGDSQATRLQNFLSQNQLSVRNVGAFIYDPRLVTFSLGGTFGLSQNRLTTDTGSESRNGRLLGYDFFASILPDRPFSLNLFANRTQSLLAGGLPGTIEVLSENRGATLFARRLYLPSTLTFRQETREYDSRSGAVVAQQRDRRNVLTYEGQRGWTDSEIDLRYEFVDLTSETLPSLSYRSHEGSLYYSFDFGPELNRRWDSRLRFFNQTGSIEMTTVNLDELMRIDHTDRLETDYRYSFGLTDTKGGETMTHSGAIHLGHRLYDSLRTDLNLGASFQTLPDGQQNNYNGRADFSYTKRIPWNGTLQAGLGGGLQYNSNRFQGTESFVSFPPGETHTADSFAQPFNLNNPFVILSSIKVWKVALPSACPPLGPPFPLQTPQDYTVQTTGDLTEIVPVQSFVLCDPTHINPGDTVAVEYHFSVSPSLAYTTTSWHFNLSLDYRWIRPYFIHEQSDQRLISGQDGRFLDSQRSDTLGTELRYDGDRLRASLLGEAKNFTSKRVAYDMARSNQFLSYRILPEMNLTLSADQTFMSYSRPQRDTLTLAGRATLSYITYIWGTNIFTEAFAGIRTLATTSMPNERIFETGLRMRGSYRKVEVLPSIEFFDRRRGETDTKDIRIMLRMIRRF